MSTGSCSPPSTGRSLTHASVTARDPHELRRSLLLGYGTVTPLTDTDAYLRAVDRADELGFDELVTYWPFGPPGSRFWSDPEVHATALARLHS